jgi:hypothetical protein
MKSDYRRKDDATEESHEQTPQERRYSDKQFGANSLKEGAMWGVSRIGAIK